MKLSSESQKPYSKQDAKYMGCKEVNISKLHLDKEIQEFLKYKGVGNVSDDIAHELGEFLQSKIKESAKKIADILRQEFGEPNGKKLT